MSFIPWDYAKRNHTNTLEGVIIANHFIEGDLQGKTIVDLVPIIRDELFYNYPGVGKNFPFYVDDDTVRDAFMNMFILKYYQHNFVHETTGYFLSRWLAKITEVNPYYVELYKTVSVDFDPLINRDYTITRERAGNEKETENANRNLSGKITTTRSNNTDFQSIHSDNPQTNFAGVDYASSMDRGNSVNNGNDSSTNTENESNDKDRTKNNSENELEKMSGFVGESKSDLLVKYRNAIVNINSQLCEEFRCLFSYFN